MVENDTWDVLVVGGGIVGAGIVRDAAMRGLRSTLIEQNDFSQGTSSRSSRLLHGGLRYLAQGRLQQVREASQEKVVLHRIAPHLSAPLAFVFPTYRHTRWSKWKLRLGVALYDRLCRGRNLGPSRSLGRDETLQRVAALQPSRLTGAVRYYDGLTCDARLVIDTLSSAARHGAVCRNHTRFEDAHRADGRWLCQLVDRRDATRCQVAARCVVNATGPWSDMLPHSRTHLRRTKGAHLVIRRDRLPIPNAVVLPDGPRILFAIPWGERVILGTTDTDYDGPIDSPHCSAEDVREILGVARRLLPTAGLAEADVISTWAGLRPLVADPHGGPSDISRRHEIIMAEPGWIDVTGGKLTTYRLMAEQTVDQIAEYLGLTPPSCRTAEEPLCDPEAVEGISQIVPPPLAARAVAHYCHGEWAVHLDDVMVRRTSWHHYLLDPVSAARKVARWMATELDWNDATVHDELSRYQQIVREDRRSAGGKAAWDGESASDSTPSDG
ncbi:MAG: glycerol-3-phosphate dehydrogenase/oxidase [Pirellulales bacterium]